MTYRWQHTEEAARQKMLALFGVCVLCLSNIDIYFSLIRVQECHAVAMLCCVFNFCFQHVVELCCYLCV